MPWTGYELSPYNKGTPLPLSFCPCLTQFLTASSTLLSVMHVKLPNIEKLGRCKPASIVGSRSTFAPTIAILADQSPLHDNGCEHLPASEAPPSPSKVSRREQPQVQSLVWCADVLTQCLDMCRAQARKWNLFATVPIHSIDIHCWKLWCSHTWFLCLQV